MGGLSTAGLSILVVEDDVLIGSLLAEMLEDLGHRVCEIATTESAAVAAASRFKPELLIVDMSLGEGDGIAAVEQICRTGLIPHLFISGDVLRVRMLLPHAVLVQKPFREADLTLAISKAIAARRP